jgi:outer membrane protein assembly factor BamA
MPLDRSSWLPALPYVDRRPGLQPAPPNVRYPVRRYRPRETLRPYAYEFEFGPGTFGNALIVTTSGSDVAGLHAFAASVTADTEEGLPSTIINYAYRRLPFDVNLRAFRRAAPRTSYELGDEQPRFVEYSTGLSSNIRIPLPRTYDSQSLKFGYSVAQVHARLPVRGLEDPFALVTREPYRGLFASTTAGWSYSNIERVTYSISGERGFAMSLNSEYAGPETGSESTLASVSGRFRGYVPLPWARHHVLAGALSGGTAKGTYARRGLYYTGGFIETPLLEVFQDGATASGFVLRGYEPGQFAGSQYALFNAEYRFPILYADRGISTLPVYLRSIAGNFFADYGGAFRQIDFDEPLDSFQMGLGAELWFDVTLGYNAGGHLRLGYARGTDSDAVDGGQFYLVASAGF